MPWPLTLLPDAPTPLHVQIRRGLQGAVRDGTLAPESQLPSIRGLAADLGVNRLTVLKAVQALERAGVLRAAPGHGVFVARPAPDLSGGAAARDPLGACYDDGGGLQSDRAALDDGMQAAVEDGLCADLVSFSAGFPPAEAIPTDRIRRLQSRLLRGPGGAALLGYAPTGGAPALRAAIADLLRDRGLTLGPADRVLITAGAQQGLALCLQALIRPGLGLAMESPGYLGAIAACRLRQIPLHAVSVDQGGLEPSRLEQILTREDVGAIYTVPTFQNPTGVTQSLRRRRRILDVAARHGAVVLEDDIYADLGPVGRRSPPLKALPGGERVIYLGSFSKSLAPGLRLGFLVATGPVADDLRRLKETLDVSSPALSQAVLTELLATGAYRRHLVKVRRLYRERREALVAALERHLPPGFRFTRPRGGMHLWVMPGRPLDAQRLLARAREAGVAFAPGSLFLCDGRETGALRLNFASHPPDVIDDGIRRLARCIRKELRS